MKKIDYLYAFSYETCKGLKFQTKVEFNEFKKNIKKIVDPLKRMLFCQQSILKILYVYRDISTYLEEEEFNFGILEYHKPWSQRTMELHNNVSSLFDELIKFYQEDIISPTNNFNRATQILLLESLKFYRIYFSEESVFKTRKADLHIVVNEPDEYTPDKIVPSQQETNT